MKKISEYYEAQILILTNNNREITENLAKAENYIEKIIM
jgi:hypothetical protein